MDKGIFIMCCWPGILFAMIVFYRLGARRRSCIPPLGWWLCVIVGAMAAMYGLSHTTVPSFAPRATAVGEALGFEEGHHGRDLYFSFRLLRDGEPPLDLETQIILPHWGYREISNGRILRVVYLKDAGRTVKNEAIEVSILAGRDAGFHDALDARPMGTWLVIPAGGALGGFGIFGLKHMKEDEEAAAREEDEASAT